MKTTDTRPGRGLRTRIGVQWPIVPDRAGPTRIPPPTSLHRRARPSPLRAAVILVTGWSRASSRALEAGRPGRYGPRRVRPEAGPGAVERKRSCLGRPGQPLTDRPDLGRLCRRPVQRVPGPSGELVLVLPPPSTVGRD